MSFNHQGQWVEEWVYTNTPPEHRAEYETKSKLYHVEQGCGVGFKEDDGYVWYRINCVYWFGDWIEKNCGEEGWKAYGRPHRAIYLVREDLLTFIKLKWL